MGYLNIFFIIIALASFIYFGLELIQLEKPEVSFVQEYDRIPQDYHVNYENFNLMVDVQTPNWETYINNSIYKIEAKYKQFFYSNYSFVVTDIPLKPCTEDLFSETNRELYRNSNTRNNWCIDRFNAPNITLRGVYNNPEFYFFGFYISACKNDSSNINNPCASQEVIDSYLNGGYFSTRYINYLIDSKNFYQPKFKILADTFFSISNKYFRDVYFYLKNVDIKLDSGFIVENWINDRFIQIGDIKENLDLRIPTAEFFSFTIRLHCTRDVIIRRYMKIQTIIANVGGILKFFSIIIGIVNSIYGSHSYYEEIYNNYFKTTITQNSINLKNLEDDSKIVDNYKNQPDSYVKKLNISHEKTLIVNNFVNNLKKSSERLKFNFFEIIFCLKFVRSKKKSEIVLFKNWNKYFKDKLSVYSILSISDYVAHIRKFFENRDFNK